MAFQEGAHREYIKEGLENNNIYQGSGNESMHVRDLRNLFDKNLDIGFFPGNSKVIVDLSGDYSKVDSWALFRENIFSMNPEKLDNQRFYCECICFQSGEYVKGERKSAYYQKIVDSRDLFIPLFIRPLTQEELPHCSNRHNAIVFDKEFFLDMHAFPIADVNYGVQEDTRFYSYFSFDQNEKDLKKNWKERFLSRGVPNKLLDYITRFSSNTFSERFFNKVGLELFSRNQFYFNLNA